MNLARVIAPPPIERLAMGRYLTLGFQPGVDNCPTADLVLDDAPPPTELLSITGQQLTKNTDS
ncbi:MAG: hypothetical protein AAGI45_16150 [Cyanobacteria bacterium P01_H01_bin.26]